jgi:hypothetical protein
VRPGSQEAVAGHSTGSHRPFGSAGRTKKIFTLAAKINLARV